MSVSAPPTSPATVFECVGKGVSWIPPKEISCIPAAKAVDSPAMVIVQYRVKLRKHCIFPELLRRGTCGGEGGGRIASVGAKYGVVASRRWQKIIIDFATLITIGICDLESEFLQDDPRLHGQNEEVHSPAAQA